MSAITSALVENSEWARVELDCPYCRQELKPSAIIVDNDGKHVALICSSCHANPLAIDLL
jgi:hypothetical protein